MSEPFKTLKPNVEIRGVPTIERLIVRGSVTFSSGSHSYGVRCIRSTHTAISGYPIYTTAGLTEVVWSAILPLVIPVVCFRTQLDVIDYYNLNTRAERTAGEYSIDIDWTSENITGLIASFCESKPIAGSKMEGNFSGVTNDTLYSLDGIALQTPTPAAAQPRISIRLNRGDVPGVAAYKHIVELPLCQTEDNADAHLGRILFIKVNNFISE